MAATSNDHTGEVSQTEKDKYHMITYLWNLKYDANEPIYETDTDSWTKWPDLWLPRGGSSGRDAKGGPG